MKRPLAALLGILLVLSICVGCGPKGDISSGVAARALPAPRRTCRCCRI